MPRKTVLILKIHQLCSTERPTRAKNRQDQEAWDRGQHIAMTILYDPERSIRIWCLHEDRSISFPYSLHKFLLFLSSSKVCVYGSSSCEHEAYLESRQYYPSMRAGPPNPGPRSAATRAGMKSGHARIRGVSIVLPTCKPATLKAAGTDICGKLRPARNRFSFCGPPECNGGPAEGTLKEKIG